MAKYKIIYEREACIGAAACEAVARKFWKMVDDNKADLIGASYNKKTKMWELIINQEDLDVNEVAAQGCPVNIIKIEKIED